MTSQSFIRNMNERRILSLLRREGSLSRAEIARRLSLTRSAMTYLAEGLMATGLVAEAEAPAANRQSRDAGRPGVALSLDPTGGYFLGAEIGVRLIRLALLDMALRTGEDKDHRPAAAADPGGGDRFHQEFPRRLRGGPALPRARARRRRHRARPGAQRRPGAASADPGMARRGFPGPRRTAVARPRQHREQHQRGGLRRGLSSSETLRRPHPVPEARQWLRRRGDHRRPAAQGNQRCRDRVRAHARRRRRAAMPLRTDGLPRNACQSVGARTLPRRGGRRRCRRSATGGRGRPARRPGGGRRPSASSKPIWRSAWSTSPTSSTRATSCWAG